jgi:hypothetical protein
VNRIAMLAGPHVRHALLCRLLGRKQRPRARYCDACNTPHAQERNRRNWLEHQRRERARLKALEAIKYRARTLVG